MANQINIDIGAAANDGTGDPLRTAFNYVNLNFANVWSTGLPNSNVQFDNNRVLTVNTNANLVLAPNGTAVVQSNVSILPNLDRVHDIGSASRRWNTVNAYYINAVSANVGSFGNLTVAVANLHITGGSNGYVLQTDGAGNLTWTAQTGGGGNGIPGGANTQVQFNNAGSFGGSASFTFNRTSNVLTVAGNISANNASINNLTSSNLVNARTGTFTGDQFSDGAMYVGSAAGTVLGSDVVIQITANSGSYSQTNFQNINSGVRASSDYILTADNGNDSTHFLDMGITSSGWDGSETNALSGLVANNGYLYVQDGNLTVGTRAGNVSRTWNFDTTGTLTVPGNVIPAGNNTQNLGSFSKQWNDLYLSNATIYMNSVPISLTAGNVLTVNGQDVVTTNSNGSVNLGDLAVDAYNIYNATGQGVTISNFSYVAENETAYINIPAGNSPGDLQIVQEKGNITLNANSSAMWSFNADNTLRLPNNSNITIVDSVITQINAVATANSAISLRAFDAGGNTTASSFFDGTDGTLNFYSYNSTTDTNYNWRFDNGGSFTLPNAPGNVYFGEGANQPVIIPYYAGLTISANRADAEASYINLDQNAFALITPGTIQIDNSSATSLGNDINLLSGDDIRLAGRNKPGDSESEGGDININAGQGADAVTSGFDTGGGGDIQIRGGLGGEDVGGGFGASSGGFVSISGGDGGASSVNTNVGSGGSLTLSAGSAGSTGNTLLGGYGGGVNISAGRTTRTNENGGSIEITAGEASGDGTGIAGYVAINIPASNAVPGGSWTFTGTGKTLQVPADSEIYGASFGNFTVGCAGNTIVTSSDYGANVKNWVFGYTGNLLAPGNIITPTNFVGTSLRTNLSDFNWSEAISNIALGATTTITLANNVFGDPWSGQVTITDVTGTTQANATWWYEAVESNQFVLYTDSTLTTLVDSSAWTAYTGGGFAATLDYGNVEINAQNIIIKSDHGDYNNKIWRFDRTGQTVFPYMDVVRGDTTGGNITGYALIMGDGTNEAIISTPNGNSTYNSSQRLVINPGKGADGTAGEGGDIYLWAGRGGDSGGSGGDIKIRGGQGGTDNGAGGYIRMEAGDGDLSGAAQAGFVEITSGRGTGSFAGGYVRITGGQGGGAGGEANISGGYGQAGAGGAVNITGGASANGLAEYGNVNISAGASTWTFNNTGATIFPNNTIDTNGNLIIQATNGIPTGVANWNGQGGWNQSLYTNLATTGGTGTGLTVDVAAGGGGYININEITIHTPGTGYTDGDVITINNENDLPGTFTITVPTYNWNFGGDSVLTVPGNIVGAQANVDLVAGAYTWTMDNTGRLTFPSLANISGGNFNAGTASAAVALNAFSPDGNTVSIQAQGNSSSAVISIFSNAGPVTSNWTFTTAPLDPSESFLYIPNGGAISTPEATGGQGGKNIFIQAGASDSVTWNSNPGGELMLKGGYGSFGDGGGGPGGDVNIEGGPSSDSHAGNVNISSGLNTWVFDYTGVTTFPNGAKLNNGTAYQFATDNTVVASLDLRDTGGAGFYTNGSGYTLRSNGSYNWIFGTDGNLTMPGRSNVLTSLNRNGDDATGSQNKTQMTFGYNGTSDYAQWIRTRHNNAKVNNAIDFYTNNGTQNATFPGSAILGGSVTQGAFQLAVYANATVRDSTISSPQPGMMIYVTGVGMQVRGATSWNTIAGSGT